MYGMTAVLAAASTVTLLAAGVLPATAQEGRGYGFHAAAAKQSQQLANALRKSADRTVPADCLYAQVSNGSPKWFVYSVGVTGPTGRDCTKWVVDAQTLLKIDTRGRAVTVAAGSSLRFWSCTDMRDAISDNRGPSRVYRDVKAAKHCTP